MQDSLTKADRKNLAIKLRGAGKTYSEIRLLLGPVPKSTLSGWFKNVELNSDQRLRIENKIRLGGQVGRQKGALKNHEKRLERLANIREGAMGEFAHLSKKDILLPGLVLYLAEGSKKTEHFEFMNSDPYLAKFMLEWVAKIGKIDFSTLKFRLYIHEAYISENCEQYWSSLLGI